MIRLIIRLVQGFPVRRLPETRYLTRLRPNPFQPGRRGIEKVAGARRMENLKSMLGARQLCVDKRVGRKGLNSATKRRTSSPHQRIVGTLNNTKGGAAWATPSR